MAMKVAVQLWSLRQQIFADSRRALALVKGMGFDYVELAGTGSQTPSEFANVISDAGIRVIGTHQPPLTLGNLTQLVDEMTAHCNIFQCKLATVMSHPLHSGTQDYYIRFSELFLSAAQALEQEQIDLCFHIYLRDLVTISESGQSGLEILVQETNTKLRLQPDIYFIHRSGKTLPEIQPILSKRCPTAHINDIDERNSQVALGSGVIDWPRTVSGLRDVGVEWLILEHDSLDAISWLSQSKKVLDQTIEGL
ncbi:MAG: sugar phosphate isomerase/epimerase [Planctomycetaceae bacterium]|nr:sugar phosphate isomerase/epimerase [Planctomycetaceae bacterium]